MTQAPEPPPWRLATSDLGGTALAAHYPMNRELLAGVHVLVVEDTDDSRELFGVALEYCGASVNTAASVTQAKQILQKRRPNVIVSDIAMPDDGLNFVRDVREMGLTIPIIATTAHVAKYDPTTLKALGFVAVLYKPLTPDHLCATVAGVTRKHDGGAAPNGLKEPGPVR